MGSTKTNDQLLIVNGSTEYHVSKKLMRKIPHFDKLLSQHSAVIRVSLNADEKAFKSIVNWLELDSIFIEMDYVIKLCSLADYLEMNDHLAQDCINYFHKNFSIEHLPVIIPQVSATSKLINSSALNSFICRHFLEIVDSKDWLTYPIETITYICKLEVVVDSEIQVFRAFILWVKFKTDFRKRYLGELLKIVRCCFLKDKDLTEIRDNDLVKSLNFEQIRCSPGEANCNCTWSETKQNYFIAIEQLNGTDLRVKVLDKAFLPLVCKVVKLDKSIPLHVLHDAHIYDVIFDSGRRMIRIDWQQAKYRLLDFEAFKSYHLKINKCIDRVQKISKHQSKDMAKIPGCLLDIEGCSLLEANEEFYLIHIDSGLFDFWSRPRTKNIKSHFKDFDTSFIATILDKKIYMLTDTYNFVSFDINKDMEFKNIGLQRFKEDFEYWDLSNFFITSSDDKVILLDESTKEVYCFNVNTQKWSSMGLLINYNYSNGIKKPIELLTLTSARLPIDTIRPCLKRKLA